MAGGGSTKDDMSGAGTIGTEKNSKQEVTRYEGVQLKKTVTETLDGGHSSMSNIQQRKTRSQTHKPSFSHFHSNTRNEFEC